MRVYERPKRIQYRHTNGMLISKRIMTDVDLKELDESPFVEDWWYAE